MHLSQYCQFGNFVALILRLSDPLSTLEKYSVNSLIKIFKGKIVLKVSSKLRTLMVFEREIVKDVRSWVEYATKSICNGPGLKWTDNNTQLQNSEKRPNAN